MCSGRGMQAAARVEPKLRTFSPFIVHAAANDDAASAVYAVQRITAAGLALGAAEFLALARLHARRANTDGVCKVLRWFALEEISLPKSMVGDVEEVFRLLSGAVGALPPASRPALSALSEAVSGAPTNAAATAAAAEAVVESLKVVAATAQPMATTPPQTTSQPQEAAQSAECASPSAALSKDVAGDVRSPPDEPCRRPCAWAVTKTTVTNSGWSEQSRLLLGPRELRNHEFELLKESLSELFVLKGPNDEFERFKLFVAREGPFELVIDGANVGFFGHGGDVQRVMKNAGGNRRNMPPQADGRRAREDLFRLDLIDAAVQLARKKSPRVLLVLHVSHAQVPRGSAAEALFQSWKELNLLYLTPRNQPDDLYWLYAAIASGKRCAVISNDEMRDHTSSLFAGRMFAHWKERHQVHITLSPHPHKLLPQLHFPSPFTKCAQEDLHTGTWHFPVEGEKYWLSAQPVFEGEDAR